MSGFPNLSIVGGSAWCTAGTGTPCGTRTCARATSPSSRRARTRRGATSAGKADSRWECSQHAFIIGVALLVLFIASVERVCTLCSIERFLNVLDVNFVSGAFCLACEQPHPRRGERAPGGGRPVDRGWGRQPFGGRGRRLGRWGCLRNTVCLRHSWTLGK